MIFTLLIFAPACDEQAIEESIAKEETKEEEEVVEEDDKVEDEEEDVVEEEEEVIEEEETVEEEEDPNFQGSRANFPRKVEYVESTDMPSKDKLYIFIMAGQSNMAGRGFVEPQDTIPNSRILSIDASLNWIQAKEPLHWYEPKFTGLDCGVSFAQTLLNSVPADVSIAMIPCAVGGSNIHNWQTNAEHREVFLLDNFKEKVAHAEQYGTIKGVIWHQGESNSSTSAATYKTKLTDVISIFRTEIGDDNLPFIMGELGQYTSPEDKQDRWDTFNDNLHLIADEDDNLSVVLSDNLTDIGDGTHMDSESQRELGKRYAAAYVELTED
ncbi:sialate O-acetylesterase [Reichenbachiella carrageenanivorans]|uniref:Sialate O-acetylesterase n=1 Tax=Reichenbachiella carrageenanivorans TaxID=2979869 RepID=A0ABY6CZW6_9BACT|nr:sialate O-acetylesterase [Reichenbachiella carrageenanivorans]UXX78930.1 sialate O-acetylesterase [Reichenbachiella carrageenanivorans]